MGCRRPTGHRVQRRRCGAVATSGSPLACFDGLVDESLEGYDRIIGLDLSDVAVDGSQHKAPFGGEGTGPNPVDRGNRGWKWSLVADRNGIPLAWEIAGANRNDCVLLDPTLDGLDGRGLLVEVETLHLDRGYDQPAIRRQVADWGIDDLICAERRPNHTTRRRSVKPIPLGLRWPIERTNSWLSNFGQLRRFIHQRLAQFALAIACVITVKLIKWADHHSPAV